MQQRFRFVYRLLLLALLPFLAAPSASAHEPAPVLIRVGVQVGHWKSNELPDELKRLRGSTGANAAGISEVQVNLAIADKVAALLTSAGVAVDLLPATVPPGYQADAFVAIHADGARSPAPRGFKLATPWRASPASQQLLEAVDAEYAAATGLPRAGVVTANMRGYYAFSYRRHVHAIAKTTPAVLIETGFLTNAADRAMLVDHANQVAAGIANGIVRYLNQRNPADTAALVPVEYPLQWAGSATGVDIRAASSLTSRVLQHAPAGARLIPIQERDGWYQVVYSRNWSIVGWVRKSEVVPTGEPLPTPPPATDS